MPTPPRILLVDDDELKRVLLARHIRALFDTAVITECWSGAEAMEYLEANPVDVIVTNHSMRPVDGVELTRWARNRFPSMPILMVTGNPGITREALRAGADRVVEFGDLAQIRAFLQRALARSGWRAGEAEV